MDMPTANDLSKLSANLSATDVTTPPSAPRQTILAGSAPNPTSTWPLAMAAESVIHIVATAMGSEKMDISRLRVHNDAEIEGSLSSNSVNVPASPESAQRTPNARSPRVLSMSGPSWTFPILPTSAAEDDRGQNGAVLSTSINPAASNTTADHLATPRRR
eukprot:scaffold273920_cov30-Tisochrysis_lutea.AAC.2